MAIPLLVSWVLVVLAREELGIKGVAIAVATWLALLAGFMALNISPFLFASAQALLDCVLIQKVFGRDITIR
jgi:hypothetical protein